MVKSSRAAESSPLLDTEMSKGNSQLDEGRGGGGGPEGAGSRSHMEEVTQIWRGRVGSGLEGVNACV